MKLGANGACCGLPRGKRYNLQIRSSGSHKMREKWVRKGQGPGLGPTSYNSQLSASFTPSPHPPRLNFRLCKHLTLITFIIEGRGVCLSAELFWSYFPLLLHQPCHLISCIFSSPRGDHHQHWLFPLTFSQLDKGPYQLWEQVSMATLMLSHAKPAETSTKTCCPNCHLTSPQNMKHGHISSGPPNYKFYGAQAASRFSRNWETNHIAVR